MSGAFWEDGERRCPWNQPDQRTLVQVVVWAARAVSRCPWNQPDQRTLKLKLESVYD